MAMRRSNTAPQPLECQARPALTRAKSTVDGFIPRLHQSSVPQFSASLAAASPLASPRDREDPFSLTSFFPALSPAREGEHWEWLRQLEPSFGHAEDELHSIYSLPDDDVDGSLPHTPGPVVFARAAEDVIEETIKGEDKMGVLSVLNTIFLTKDAEDEAVDHESLYLALSGLRHAESMADEEAGYWSEWWPVRWALHAMSSIV